MSFRGTAIGVVLTLSVSASVAAQQPGQPTIAELARQTEASKASVKKAKKRYTNADLSRDMRGEPTPTAAAEPAAGYVSASLGKPISAEEMVARSEEKAALQSGATQPEEHWRQRAESLRVQIAKLQARITALNKPSPTANAGTIARRDAELVKINQGLSGLQKQWATLEESARVANIKLEWLEPRPVFEQ
jgi:hypothetical protein